MEIRFTPAEEAFRAEARAWIEANKPRTPRPEDLRARRAYDCAWQRTMYDAGWDGIAWPKAYGGRGATLMEQLIWFEEYARADAPDLSTLFVGLNHAGPTLMACGTEAQKAYHLPRILRGEVVWCQGFSEPNAGSDLAALQTRAVIDGLAIKTLAGNSDFCEVFYDGVRSPLANVVGRLNDGWRVAMASLSFERGTAFVPEQVRLARRVEELAELARTVPGPRGQARAIDDDEIARRLATFRAEVAAMRAMTYRSLSLAARTGVPGPEASLIRLFFSELVQRIDALAMEILGAAGL